jgi:hypothetical protein
MQKFTTSESDASRTENTRGATLDPANLARPKDKTNFSKALMVETIAFEFCEEALYATNWRSF